MGAFYSSYLAALSLLRRHRERLWGLTWPYCWTAVVNSPLMAVRTCCLTLTALLSTQSPLSYPKRSCSYGDCARICRKLCFMVQQLREHLLPLPEPWGIELHCPLTNSFWLFLFVCVFKINVFVLLLRSSWLSSPHTAPDFWYNLVQTGADPPRLGIVGRIWQRILYSIHSFSGEQSKETPAVRG